jgi:hypothetical protein
VTRENSLRAGKFAGNFSALPRSGEACEKLTLGAPIERQSFSNQRRERQCPRLAIDLTPRQRAFVQEMKASPEATADGFDILAKREDGPAFFPTLKAERFFAPGEFPRVIQLDNGQFQLCGWPAAEYLSSVAKKVSEKYPFADEVVELIVSIANAAKDDADKRDNYFLWHRFVEVLVALPVAAITPEIIDTIPLWLDSRFDRGFVGAIIGDQLLPRLIEHGKIDFALSILAAMSALRTHEDAESAAGPATVVEGYWYKNALAKNLAPLANAAPAQMVALFQKRTNEAFPFKVGA